MCFQPDSSLFDKSEAQPMVVMGHIPVQPATVMAQPVIVGHGQILPTSMATMGQPGQLMPPHSPGSWRYGLFDAACQWGSCFYAWCCPCFPSGQIASKLKAAGLPTCMGYSAIVLTFIGLTVLDLLLTLAGADLNPQYIFIVIVLIKLREIVRHHYQIPGGWCNDCFASWCCMPCAIQQLIGQLWAVPQQDPGCSTGEKNVP